MEYPGNWTLNPIISHFSFPKYPGTRNQFYLGQCFPSSKSSIPYYLHYKYIYGTIPLTYWGRDSHVSQEGIYPCVSLSGSVSPSMTLKVNDLALADSLARIHKGSLSTNRGLCASYDAFYAFFTNLVCKEQKEVWRNKRRFELKPWSELKPCFVNSGPWVSLVSKQCEHISYE